MMRMNKVRWRVRRYTGSSVVLLRPLGMRRSAVPGQKAVELQDQLRIRGMGLQPHLDIVPEAVQHAQPLLFANSDSWTWESGY
jgi:hypothetical protein